MRRRFSVGTLILMVAVASGLVAFAASVGATPPQVAMGTATNATYTTVDVTGTINPEGEGADLEGEWFFEVSSDGGSNWERKNVSGQFGEPVEGTITELKGGTTYKVRLTAHNYSEFSDIHSPEPSPEFTTLAVDPPVSATADEASEVAYTTAKATGEVERPAGNADPAFDVNCRFEYLSDQQFDENVANGGSGFENAASADCEQNPITEAKSEDEGPEVPVSAKLENLSINTTYHLRLHAENAGGVVVDDAPDTFTTLNPSAPVVTIDPVTTFDATTAHFSGHVTPGGNDQVFATDWEFHCSPLPCPGLTGHLEPDATADEETVEFDVKGLEPNSIYNVELSATNQGGTNSAGPVSFTTSASAPDVTTLQAFPLEGATSALLGGRVNPRNSGTTYWVEYGPTDTYGQSTQPDAAGSGSTGKLVSQQITGLTPGSTYHFRLVAEGAGMTTHGDDVVFTMPVPAGPETCENAQYRVDASAALPDCRAYELVSPPDAGVPTWSTLDNSADRLLTPWSQVAADGSSVLWRATTAVPGIPDSSGLFDPYRSFRAGGSWHTEYIGFPSQTAPIRPPDLEFASANADRFLWITFNLSLDPTDHDPVPLPSEASVFNAFQYRDLYTTAADGSNTRFNRSMIENTVPAEEPILAGVSKDVSKVLFTDDRQLVSEAPLNPPFPSLYWNDGQTTKLVSKDESGTPVLLNFNWSGLSADGSTAVFTSQAGRTLNIWSADSGTTTKAFGPVPEDKPTGDLLVDSISADGNTIFFTTSAPMSADDTDTSVDLYEYDASTDQLTLISAPSGGGPSGNSDACAAPLPSDSGSYARCDIAPVIEPGDGSQAYFVSPEQIVPGRGVDGAVNLFRAADGEVHFVATLGPSDPVFAGRRIPGGDLVTSIRTRQVRLTPDGSKLVFMSRAALTGYDNAGFMEIYLYDPASGGIVCASCRADGAPPVADSSLFTFNAPGAGVIGGFYKLYSANTDTHGDRLFFNSADAIVSRDVNGKNDVYEYTVASGTAALISSGRSNSPSAYAGSGEDGRDVFFFTADSLVPQDQNGAVYKVYDARRGGGFPAPPALPAPCEGDGCHGAPSASSGGPGTASSTFDGAGNPVPRKITCREGTRKVRRHGRVRCIRVKKNHHHKRDAKHGGRAGR